MTMGIVFDLTQSPAVTFKHGLVPSFGLVKFMYDMPEFAIRFGISFDPIAKHGVGGTPKDAEPWSIGIVQNLLYERYLFEYEKPKTGGGFSKRIISTEFQKPTVDILERSWGGGHSMAIQTLTQTGPKTHVP
jgi:hypothetical protein